MHLSGVFSVFVWELLQNYYDLTPDLMPRKWIPPAQSQTTQQQIIKPRVRSFAMDRQHKLLNLEFAPISDGLKCIQHHRS